MTFPWSSAFRAWLLVTSLCLFLEWKLPGFVSFVFPGYWLVLFLLFLGGMSAHEQRTHEQKTGGFLTIFLPLAGLVLFDVILSAGDVFGVLQLPFALISLLFFLCLTAYFVRS